MSGQAWIFQSNPREYDLVERLDQGDPPTAWDVTRYREVIAKDDRVFFWVAGADAGIYAVGRTTSDAFEYEGHWQVNIEVEEVVSPHLSRARIQKRPALEQLLILRQPSATNFRLSHGEVAALEELVGDRNLAPERQPQLFWITEASAEAREHLQLTLVDGVPLEEALRVLPEVGSELQANAEDGRVRAWGCRPGSAGEGKWHRLGPGDIVLVYSEQRYVFWGRVYAKARNREAARHFWGTDVDGSLWECMYFLAPLRAMDVYPALVRDSLGYRPGCEPDLRGVVHRRDR